MGVWVGVGGQMSTDLVSLAAELTLYKETHGRTPGLGR